MTKRFAVRFFSRIESSIAVRQVLLLMLVDRFDQK
jgi:hypothetical protein